MGGILRFWPLSGTRCCCDVLPPWGSSPVLGAGGLAPAAITGPACANVLVCCGAGEAEVVGACCCDGGLGWWARGKVEPVCLWTSWLSTREGSGWRPNSPGDTGKWFYLKFDLKNWQLHVWQTFEHPRLNCEDREVLFDSAGFISQLDVEGGAMGVPSPGSRPVELLCPWVLTVGPDWDEGRGPKPGPFSCSSIWAPALAWVLLAWPKSPKPAPRTDDWEKQEWQCNHQSVSVYIDKGMCTVSKALPKQHEHSLWNCWGWEVGAVAAEVSGGGVS